MKLIGLTIQRKRWNYSNYSLPWSNLMYVDPFFTYNGIGYYSIIRFFERT